MKAPETIYSDGIPNLAGCIFAGRHKTDQSNLEYRLVGECEWRCCSNELVLYQTSCGNFNVEKHGDFCHCGNKIKVIYE